MTINEFIKEQVEERAEAAKKLSEPLEINGIQITAGCTSAGVVVDYGIEKLAERLGCDICVEYEEARYESKYTNRIRYFVVAGTRFYTNDFITREEPNDAEHSAKEHE